MSNKEFIARNGLIVGSSNTLVANVVTGNVGIGTSSPNAYIHVIGSGGSEFKPGVHIANARFFLNRSNGANTKMVDDGYTDWGISSHIVSDTTAYYTQVYTYLGDTDYGGDIYFNKTRSSDGATRKKVESGDQLISLDSFVDDGVSSFAVNPASIRAFVDGTTSAANVPGRISFHTLPYNAVYPAPERMRITSNGNILIGTTTDSGQRLVVSGSANIAGGTVTSSNPILDLSQTWNAASSIFTGLRLNVTDTSSNASSLLADYQVAGTSKFKIDKSGGATFAGNITISSRLNFSYYAPNSPFIATNIDVNNMVFSINSRTMSFDTNGTINGVGKIAFGTNWNGYDTYLTRISTSVLQFGDVDTAGAPTAQTLRVQSASGIADTAGANWTIRASAGTGTGAGGSIIFQVAPASTTGSTKNGYVTALTIEGTGKSTFNRATSTAQGLYIGSATAGFYADQVYWVKLGSSGWGGDVFTFNSSGQIVTAGTTSGIYLNNDVIITREAAGTLALRNGTNAQAFKVYNTFTDASNYERFAVGWGSNILYLVTEAGGTGSSRAIWLGTGGSSPVVFYTGNTGRWSVDSSGNLTAYADNTYDIGASGATRPRTGYFGTSVVSYGANDGITSQNDFPMLSCIRPSQTARFTTTFGNSNKYNFRVSRGNVNGGANFIGVTDGDATAMVFQGWVGSTTVTNVPMLFRAYKWDGSTDVAALAATEPAMSFTNGATTILQLRGDGLVQFGGTTSSFPALKRSSTALQARLADDSNFTNFQSVETLVASQAMFGAI